MKNTAKKILALVFAVAMICTLAVPAFAADDDVTVNVTVVDNTGKTLMDKDVTVSASRANVEKVLNEAETTSVDFDIKSSTGKLASVNDIDVDGAFDTDGWFVAVNGKLVSDDLGTVTVEKDDSIVVYWGDTTLGTKLAQVDASKISQGIISLYYYDAEGTKQPLTDAVISIEKGTTLLRDKTNVLDEDNTDEYTKYEYYFTTDEAGQVWISPEYLASAGTLKVITAVENDNGVRGEKLPLIANLKAVEEEDGYSKDEVAYYNANLARNIVDVEVVNATITVKADMYNVAGSTGDMTMVYVLVAAAAIVTLGAVVVMKKKAAQ